MPGPAGQAGRSGYYIPATTPNTNERFVTIDSVESRKTAIQTNNVQVDDRGLAYWDSIH